MEGSRTSLELRRLQQLEGRKLRSLLPSKAMNIHDVDKCTRSSWERVASYDVTFYNVNTSAEGCFAVTLFGLADSH